MKILIDVMRPRGRVEGRPVWSLDAPEDLASRSFAHPALIRGRSHEPREQKIPPGSRVADALGNARQENLESRSRRIRQHERDREISLPQSPGNGERTLTFPEGQHRIEGGMVPPQLRQFGGSEQSQMSPRECFAETP